MVASLQHRLSVGTGGTRSAGFNAVYSGTSILSCGDCKIMFYSQQITPEANHIHETPQSGQDLNFTLRSAPICGQVRRSGITSKNQKGVD